MGEVGAQSAQHTLIISEESHGEVDEELRKRSLIIVVVISHKNLACQQRLLFSVSQRISWMLLETSKGEMK